MLPSPSGVGTGVITGRNVAVIGVVVVAVVVGALAVAELNSAALSVIGQKL